MSHYNNGMFISRFRAIDSVEISTVQIDKDVAEVRNKNITVAHSMRV